MIKIVTGYSEKGGSTNAFIELTNELNKHGVDTVFYGPHQWHLSKCKSGLLDPDFSINPNDILICHFLYLPSRPNAKKVILSCHEKNLFEVGKVKQYWDDIVFLHDKHKNYHNEYNGSYSIIPNLKPNLVKKEKGELKKIAGIIGSFDENKQTHVSIKRALADNCEKVYLFGPPQGEYFEKHVKPLCDGETVIIKGFLENKQEMYDMIGCVYHSSKSEVACLVKDECILTNTKFYGNENTDHEVSTLTNEEIINKWVELFNM